MSEAQVDDPELRILRELEEELLRELAQLDDGAPQHPVGELRRRSVRITRRALVLVALVSLVGSSALAASIVLSGSKRQERRPDPTLLAAGAAGGQRWQLQTYLYQGTTCIALFAGTTVSSRCNVEPAASGLSAVSALAGSSRIVSGLAGTRVLRVHVQVADHSAIVRTRSPRPDSATHARWFVAILPSAGNLDDAAPALLSARGSAGQRLGTPLLDCSLGASSALCKEAASRIAAGELASH